MIDWSFGQKAFHLLLAAFDDGSRHALFRLLHLAVSQMPSLRHLLSFSGHASTADYWPPIHLFHACLLFFFASKKASP